MTDRPVADDPLAAGWALKERCYSAWHTAPSRARAAADALAALAAGHADPTLHALADWTEGIAALTEGRLADALARLASAQAAFTALGDGQHAAEAQVPQIVALAMLGRDAQALQCAESALARFVAHGDERSAGKVELNLGTMLSRQDRHADAEQRYRRAAVRLARVGDPELSIVADVALANALTWQFRFDDALRIFQRGRMRARARGFTVLLAQMHQGIGRIELHRGRWHRALPELAEASRLLSAAGAPPQRVIEAEAALADGYLAVNLLTEALTVYDRVIAAARAMDAPTETAWATLQRARALGRLGQHPLAIDGFAQARALYEAADNRATLGFIALSRGRVELAAGQADAAARSATEAGLALAECGITGWQLDARCLLAAAQAAAGDAAAARHGFEAVLAEAADLPPLALACHTGLGGLAAAAGDWPRARQALEQALEGVDQQRAALPADEFRSALGAEADTAHGHLVDVALAEGDAARLLADLDRGQARALAWGLPAADAAGPRSVDSTRLQWLREQWRAALAEGDSDRLPALARQTQALEQALLEAHRRAQLQAGPAGVADELALDVPALQRALGPDRALLAYHLQPGRLLACVVTNEGVAYRSGPADDLAGRVRDLRFQLDAMRFGAARLQRHGPQLLARARHHLQALHQRLWQPLVPLLGKRRQVVVVPHGALHYVPFAGLFDGRQWLAQTHQISLAPSASVWLARQRRPPPRFDRVLALGVGSAALPQIGQELQAIAEAFGPAARLLREAEATGAALQAEAPLADVLHLACHGRFRANSPAFSSLQLGDGPVTLQDLRSLRLQASLVTLSACETGLSHLAPGDEVLGLVRAFLLAGAGAVLATLWPVDDAATAALVSHFYAALRTGAGPAAALQQAQAAAAAAGDHPFHWAAFVLHGRDAGP